MLYTIVCGQYPFSMKCQNRLIKRIRSGKLKTKHLELLRQSNASAELQDLILCLLIAEPAKRPSAKQALAHRWFKDETPKIVRQESLSSQLNFNPGFKTVEEGVAVV